MTIIFRTKKYIRTEASWSNKLINLRWTDWSDIDTYDGGDVRDILWKKWGWGDTLYRKKREEYARIELSIFHSTTPGDYFYNNFQNESRFEFKQAIKTSLQNSAKHLWIRCQEYNLNDPVLTKEKIFRKEIKNSLFCVLCSYEDLSLLIPFFRWMERVNDIVFIVTLHPFEVHGGMPLTFLGQTFSVGNSEESYTQTTKEVRKQIIASGMDTLSIASNENIVKKLNFFFKNRMLYV
jgi:hypothetical protein